MRDIDTWRASVASDTSDSCDDSPADHVLPTSSAAPIVRARALDQEAIWINSRRAAAVMPGASPWRSSLTSLASNESWQSAQENLDVDDSSCLAFPLPPPVGQVRSPYLTHARVHSEPWSDKSQTQSSIFDSRSRHAPSPPSSIAPSEHDGQSPKLRAVQSERDLSPDVTQEMARSMSQEWREELLRDVIAGMPASPLSFPPRQPRSRQRTLEKKLDSEEQSLVPPLSPQSEINIILPLAQSARIHAAASAIAKRRRTRVMPIAIVPSRSSSRFVEMEEGAPQLAESSSYASRSLPKPALDKRPVMPLRRSSRTVLETPSFSQIGRRLRAPSPLPLDLPFSDLLPKRAPASAPVLSADELEMLHDGIYVLSPRGPVTNVPPPVAAPRRMSLRSQSPLKAPVSSKSVSSSPRRRSSRASLRVQEKQSRSLPPSPAVQELQHAIDRHAQQEAQRWAAIKAARFQK